ncbi:hypothetical protein AAG906_029000 [Vitis piasezkii]
MATENSQIIIPNAQEPTKPLTMITIHNSIKLTPTNYISWKTQMEAILIGYDLQNSLMDPTLPPTTITTNNVVSTNPAYQTWLRQDKLLFGALVGTLSPTLTTCSPLKPGDELATLGKPLDHEDRLKNPHPYGICSCHQCSLHSMVCHQSHSLAPWVHIRTHSRYHKKFSHQHPRQPSSCSSIPWSLPMVQYSRSCSLPLSSFPTTVSTGATTSSSRQFITILTTAS